MTKSAILFTPLELPNGTVIPNRFFKSAMHEALGSKEGQPTQAHVNLYQTWAQGGAAVLMTGNVMVDRQATAEPGNVVFDEQTDKEMLKQWAQAGKRKGNHIWVQLNHPGKSVPVFMKQETVAPSAIGMAGDLGKAFALPRELGLRDIKRIVDQFAYAAQLAKETGFTGVQIHAAHGYLVNQFLSPADNKRNDLYGGSIQNRMRFLKEIYQAIRKLVGPDFPISLKLNSSDFTKEGFSEEDSLLVIQEMTKLGIDLIEISGGNYESQKMASNADQVFFLDFARKVSRLERAPIVLTGGFKSTEHMEKAILEDGLAMVGIARSMVLYPHMVEEIRQGSYQGATLPRLTTGFKKLDSQLGGLAMISYYEQQMDRLSHGKAPKISRDAWCPLLDSIRRFGLVGIMPKRG